MDFEESIRRSLFSRKQLQQKSSKNGTIPHAMLTVSTASSSSSPFSSSLPTSNDFMFSSPFGQQLRMEDVFEKALAKSAIQNNGFNNGCHPLMPTAAAAAAALDFGTFFRLLPSLQQPPSSSVNGCSSSTSSSSKSSSCVSSADGLLLHAEQQPLDLSASLIANSNNATPTTFINSGAGGGLLRQQIANNKPNGFHFDGLLRKLATNSAPTTTTRKAATNNRKKRVAVASRKRRAPTNDEPAATTRVDDEGDDQRHHYLPPLSKRKRQRLSTSGDGGGMKLPMETGPLNVSDEHSSSSLVGTDNETTPLGFTSDGDERAASAADDCCGEGGNALPLKTKGCNKYLHRCPHCTFTTYMSQHMKSHLKAHENFVGQMYTCDVCGMAFSQKANMHRHRGTHSGVKPYECRFCQKRFFRKDQMQEHSMTHIKTGDDFDCPVAKCTEKFSQHAALRSHLDTEHQVSSSAQAHCKRCTLVFSNSRRLLLHYQTKHDDELALLASVAAKQQQLQEKQQQASEKQQDTASSHEGDEEEEEEHGHRSSVDGSLLANATMKCEADEEEECSEAICGLEEKGEEGKVRRLKAEADNIDERRTNFPLQTFLSSSSKRQSRRGGINKKSQKSTTQKASLNSDLSYGLPSAADFLTPAEIAAAVQRQMMKAERQSFDEANKQKDQQSAQHSHAAPSISGGDSHISRGFAVDALLSSIWPVEGGVHCGEGKIPSLQTAPVAEPVDLSISSTFIDEAGKGDELLLSSITSAASHPLINNHSATNVFANNFSSHSSSPTNANVQSNYYLPTATKRPDCRGLMMLKNGVKPNNATGFGRRLDDLLAVVIGQAQDNNGQGHDSPPTKSSPNKHQARPSRRKRSTKNSLGRVSLQSPKDCRTLAKTVEDGTRKNCSLAEMSSFFPHHQPSTTLMRPEGGSSVAAASLFIHSPSSSSTGGGPPTVGSNISSVGENNASGEACAEDHNGLLHPFDRIYEDEDDSSSNVASNNRYFAQLIKRLLTTTSAGQLSPDESKRETEKSADSSDYLLTMATRARANKKPKNGATLLECSLCGIFFSDQKDPWRCNLCGQLLLDKYTFTAHIISTDHGSLRRQQQRAAMDGIQTTKENFVEVSSVAGGKTETTTTIVHSD